MSSYYIKAIIYLLAQLLPFIYGIYRYRIMDHASRYFCYMAGISFLGELVALYAAVVYRNNLGVYNVVGIANLIALCLYFNSAIRIFHKHRIGIMLAIISVIVWLITVFGYHELKTTNPYYMLYEGIITLIMTTLLMGQLLTHKSKGDFILRNSVQFWFSWLLFFYWCISITEWVCYEHFAQVVEENKWINEMLWAASTIGNFGFFYIFYKYPKMKQVNASR